ncbi:MAG: 5-formyltetrahydrofolate cyclo-ligase [Oscillospiraceae bacterium]|nr:5-formyltetrahydrofolate cyclo-ligase [Oscillospiraceae bacterium]
MDKKALRWEIREKKRAMTEEEIISRSEKLGALFTATEAYRNAKSVYGYLPYNQEVRTVPMLQKALEDGKRVAVPKVYGDTMKFLWLVDLSQVEKSEMGIPEPVEDGPVADDKTALVLMPGVAFTQNGDRMGYGGGYYDRFLACEPDHPTVALCYEFQMVESLPTEEFDIPVDTVLWA